MFLPAFLLLVFCYLLIVVRMLKRKAIGVKKFIFLIAFIPVLCAWDRLIAEVWASVWVNEATNPSICPMDRGNFLSLMPKQAPESICRYSNDFNQKNNLENYFFVKQFKYIYFKGMETVEVDFPELDMQYEIKILKSPNEKKCNVIANNYLADINNGKLVPIGTDDGVLFIKNNCASFERVDRISGKYKIEYKQEEAAVFGYKFFRKRYKRMINSENGELIYERRLAESDEGFFAQFILSNPETGMYGRGLIVGSDK